MKDMLVFKVGVSKAIIVCSLFSPVENHLFPPMTGTSTTRVRVATWLP